MFFYSSSGRTCAGTVGDISGVAFLWSCTAHRQRLGPDVQGGSAYIRFTILYTRAEYECCFTRTGKKYATTEVTSDVFLVIKFRVKCLAACSLLSWDRLAGCTVCAIGINVRVRIS